MQITSGKSHGKSRESETPLLGMHIKAIGDDSFGGDLAPSAKNHGPKILFWAQERS
jgi:hypothetical protein